MHRHPRTNCHPPTQRGHLRPPIDGLAVPCKIGHLETHFWAIPFHSHIAAIGGIQRGSFKAYWPPTTYLLLTLSAWWSLSVLVRPQRLTIPL
jgi:hypothetical protein